MRDEHDMRLFTDHRPAFVGFAAEMIDAMSYALCKLQAIHWDAPWKQKKNRCV